MANVLADQAAKAEAQNTELFATEMVNSCKIQQNQRSGAVAAARLIEADLIRWL